MARIKDVAFLAGVSTATVSRVVNGAVVRPELAEAVRRAVKELNYTPHRTARSLRRGAGDVVALVLPDIENPFFTSLARGVEDVAQSARLSVVLCNTDDLVAKEERYLKIAERENMAGVVIAPAGPTPALGPLIERGRAVVVVDRAVQARVDHVVLDNVALGGRGARMLIDRGFRRIACVTGPLSTSTARERAEGWRAELRHAGLSADDELLVYADFRVDGGHEAMAHLAATTRPPDAVLATNNLVGVGVLQVLAERGGEQLVGVAVIGELPFVTSRLADVSVVPLRPRDMGVSAATMLVERINGLLDQPRHVVQDSAVADAAIGVVAQL